jgi:hypothetical protein
MTSLLLERPLPRRDAITIPTLWIAVALSLLIHGLALWQWLPEMKKHFLTPDSPDEGKGKGSLVVNIAPPAKPKASPPPAPAAQAAPPTRGVPPQPSRSAPPPMASARPGPSLPLPRPPQPVVTPSPPRPAPLDLSSYIEAQRRARAETQAPAPVAAPQTAPPQPVEDENARRDRIIAANLGTQNTPSFGYDPARGGGVFQIQSMTSDEASFVFYGWNKEIRRNSRQTIEVKRGTNPDIRLAVVRRMIVIIREHEREDFTWVSQRLGRDVTLSARPGDTAGLEDFLLKEFFVELRSRQ